MENLESIQDSIFILVYKLGYSEDEVLKLDRWVMKRRLKQFEEYQKAKKAEMQKEMDKIKAK